MINLIPPHGKKAVRFEYWMRVVTVWALLLAAVLIAVGVLLIPSYVLLSAKLSALEREVAETGGTDEVFREAERVVADANTLAKQLVKEPERVPLSDVITEIDALAGGGVSVRNYVATHEEDELSTVEIQGTASSRESLTRFKAALDRSAMFERAVVPISDLARDENLPFVVTAVLAPVTKGP